ncbi:hypothetical protein GCM10009733_048570 [Nonomuraea maheshkhaliensis]|uniref:Uncharacterized protein n=1 Tax=Nonomuraea maheshkhaliensis TaxID=419590 RepID=A0ABP4RCA9_9ACTN
MKARQMSGAFAVAVALLAAGAITGPGAAMAEDRQSPNVFTVCGTGPVYRSAHVHIDTKCDIKVNVERPRLMQHSADYVAEDLALEDADAQADE